MTLAAVAITFCANSDVSIGASPASSRETVALMALPAETAAGRHRRNRCIAGHVGGYIVDADQGLPFTVSRGVFCRIGIELDAKARGWRAVEGSGNGNLRAGCHGAGQYRKVLQVVGTTIAIPAVVRRDTGGPEVDTQQRVGMNRVADNGVVRSIHNIHAVQRIECDDISHRRPHHRSGCRWHHF